MWSVLTERRVCEPREASEIFLSLSLSRPGAHLCCSHHLSFLPGLFLQLKLGGLHSGNWTFGSFETSYLLVRSMEDLRKEWAEEGKKAARLGFRFGSCWRTRRRAPLLSGRPLSLNPLDFRPTPVSEDRSFKGTPSPSLAFLEESEMITS